MEQRHLTGRAISQLASPGGRGLHLEEDNRSALEEWWTDTDRVRHLLTTGISVLNYSNVDNGSLERLAPSDAPTNGTVYEIPDNGSLERLAPSDASTNGTVYEIPAYLFITVNVFYCFIFVCGTLGNLIVIFVSCRGRSLETSSTTIYVTNLGVSDILVLLICMSSSFIDFHMKEVWILGDVMCRLVPYLENLVAHTSILLITGISCDRFYAIYRPIQVHVMCTTKRTARVVASIWALTIITSLPFLIFSQTEVARFYDGTLVTVCRTSIDSPVKQAYVILTVTVFFAIPFALLTILYTLIVRKLCHEEKEIERSFGPSTTCQAIYKERRCVVYMLIFIVVFFFVSLLPIRALALWFIYSTREQQEALGFEPSLNLISAFRVLFYLNSVANPVLYNVVSSRFREAFRRVMSREVRRSSSVSVMMPRLTCRQTSGNVMASRTTLGSRDSLLFNIRGLGTKATSSWESDGCGRQGSASSRDSDSIGRTWRGYLNRTSRI